MKKIFKFCILSMCLFLMVGCSTEKSNINGENVKLKFIQHSYINQVQDVGYYFKNDQLATTELIYQKCCFLDANMIDSFYKKINYIVPEFNGDGYWNFTFFTKDFDKKTGLASNFLSEQILDEDTTIHFAIYG